MVNITVQECEALYEKFLKYTETAEQHEFVQLLIIHEMLNGTKRRNWDMPQKQRRAMFRVVLQAIGEDYSQYKEVEDEEQTLAE